jgi:hypothetical protein
MNTPMNKKSLIYAFFVVLIVVGGLCIVVYFSLQAKTLPKIKPSGFKDETEIALAMHQRLQQEILKNRIFFIGVSDVERYQGNVLIEFVKQLRLVHPKIQNFLADESTYTQLQSIPEFKNLGLEFQVFALPEKSQDFFSTFGQLANAALSNQEGGVLVILPALQATKRFEDGIVSTLYRGIDPKQIPPSISFVMSRYFVSTDQNGQSVATNIPCNTSEKDQAGTGDLGCLIMRICRVNERKLLKYKNLSGFMDQMSSNEYLLILKDPQNQAAN